MALIPLGILSAAGSSVSSLTDYELIETAFGTGSSATISFSSIPADYKHLQVRWAAKSSSTGSNMNLQLNGVTSSVYARHYLRGQTTTISSASNTTTSNISFNDGMATSTTTGLVAAGIMDILDYASSTKNKTIRALYGQSGNTYQVYLLSGLYGETTPVSSLSFTAGTGNFTNITRFSLYGIKG